MYLLYIFWIFFAFWNWTCADIHKSIIFMWQILPKWMFTCSFVTFFPFFSYLICLLFIIIIYTKRNFICILVDRAYMKKQRKNAKSINIIYFYTFKNTFYTSDAGCKRAVSKTKFLKINFVQHICTKHWDLYRNYNQVRNLLIR